MEWGFEVCGDTLPNISTYFAKYLHMFCQVSSDPKKQPTKQQNNKRPKQQNNYSPFFPFLLRKLNSSESVLKSFFTCMPTPWVLRLDCTK